MHGDAEFMPVDALGPAIQILFEALKETASIRPVRFRRPSDPVRSADRSRATEGGGVDADVARGRRPADRPAAESRAAAAAPRAAPARPGALERGVPLRAVDRRLDRAGPSAAARDCRASAARGRGYPGPAEVRDEPVAVDAAVAASIAASRPDLGGVGRGRHAVEAAAALIPSIVVPGCASMKAVHCRRLFGRRRRRHREDGRGGARSGSSDRARRSAHSITSACERDVAGVAVHDRQPVRHRRIHRGHV